MTRWDIINYYLRQNLQSKSYLEIGIENRDSFERINALDKDGVDPNIECRCNYHMTSDDFFRINQKKYDVVFIDGLHHCSQVCRDINNSLNSLKENGIIIIHDCIPDDEISQRIPRVGDRWMGTVWKAFVLFRCVRQDLEMFVVDTDSGVGVIIPNKCQQLFVHPEVIGDYGLFAQCIKEALNIISVGEWQKRWDRRDI